ncbi:MAG: hypothetical protein EA398_04320 [Deltaproteobacteria bacterium]|nr:MAG: hypothetical protein EA398_04320 [Deltaproteobacteria bacterium]
MRAMSWCWLGSLVLLVGVSASADAMDPEVSELMELFADEPDVAAVQQAALRWANLDRDRVPGWYRQVRISAVLPRTRIEGNVIQRDTDQSDLTQNFDFTDPLEATPSGSRQLLRETDYRQLQVRGFMQWELNELVWDSDVLRVSLEGQRLVRLRQDVLNTVTALYFDRRERQLEFELNPPADLNARVRAQLAIEQLTASLDALTGGWFREQLP